jgi:prolyl-tRNA synthetase
MLEQYRQLACDDLAMHVLAGVKSESERFAGAVETYGIEALMPDGKALQSGTSHFLGQNFAKAYDIKYLDEDNTEKYVWTTSWGVSHRIMGGMLLVHGDDRGLILPPKVAPYHVVVVPVVKDEDRADVLGKCHALVQAVRKLQYNGEALRVKLDERQGLRPGFKFADWELRGVPLRLEVGPRDVAGGVAVLANRLSGQKREIAVDYATAGLDGESVLRSLEELQVALYTRSREEMLGRIFEVEDYAQLKECVRLGRGFALAAYDGTSATEARIKEETGATTRMLLPQMPESNVKCVLTGRPAERLAYFAASY